MEFLTTKIRHLTAAAAMIFSSVSALRTHFG